MTDPDARCAKLRPVPGCGAAAAMSRAPGLLAGVLACVIFGSLAATPANAGEAPPCDGDATLSGILAKVVLAHHVPGMGLLVLRSHGVVAVAAAGWRKAGDATPVTVADEWHIGSCTKMMTATLVARLVERERLRWDASIASLAPPQVPCAPAWRDITLDQLLCHRAGLQANLDWGTLPSRAAALGAVLAVAPPHPVGDFRYSNAGYVTVGALCEQQLGHS